MIQKQEINSKKRRTKENIINELHSHNISCLTRLLKPPMARSSDDEKSSDNHSIERSIKKEVENFLELLNEERLADTRTFWIERKDNCPILYKIALKLLSIPSTSAHIERFYSFSGIICQKRSLNISDDIIIKRAMLKANNKMLHTVNACV